MACAGGRLSRLRSNVPKRRHGNHRHGEENQATDQRQHKSHVFTLLRPERPRYLMVSGRYSTKSRQIVADCTSRCSLCASCAERSEEKCLAKKHPTVVGSTGQISQRRIETW